MASGSDRDLRRRFNRDPPPPDDTLARNSSVTPTPPSLPPLRSLGSRARGPMATFAGSGSRSSRYRPADRGASERYRPNFEGRGLNSGLDDTDRNIENTNSQLRALLDYTINPIMQRAAPILPPPLPDYDLAEGNRRAKRRKLNSDRSTSSFRGFRYGKYGQVEPGQLTLEIVSCDGGIYSNEHAYPPENILRDDNSVYCTKGNRCNIVLRHQGTTVFSLSELIIKAPGSKFSCPYVYHPNSPAHCAFSRSPLSTGSAKEWCLWRWRQMNCSPARHSIRSSTRLAGAEDTAPPWYSATRRMEVRSLGSSHGRCEPTAT